jgi:hypothetical protein
MGLQPKSLGMRISEIAAIDQRDSFAMARPMDLDGVLH